MNDIREKNNTYYPYVIIFVIFLVIGFFVPVIGDDWEISLWYREQGIVNLLCQSIRMWSTYNGRILNNFFDMFLGRYHLLWIFTSSLVYISIIYFGLKNFKLHKKKSCIFLFLTLFLLLSCDFRKEIVFYKICNISYCMPAFIIFLLCYFLFSKRNQNNSRKDMILIFLLSLASTLWIENLTIGITLLVGTILFIDYIKNKKVNKFVLFSFLGCIAGAFVIFLSPGFLNRYNDTTSEISSIKLIMTYFPVVLHSVTLNEKIVYLVFSISSLIVFRTKKIYNKDVFNKTIYVYLIFLTLYLLAIYFFKYLGSISYSLVPIYQNFEKIFVNYNSFIAICIMISMLLSIIGVIFALSKNQEREKLLYLYLLSMFSVAPMVLSPGERNYILLILSLIIIVIVIFAKIDINYKYYKLIKISLFILTFIGIENYHYVLRNAYIVSLERMKNIEAYKLDDTKDTLYLPVYDDNIYGNGNSLYYEESIINYYRLRYNTKIIFDDGFIFNDILVDKVDKNLYQIKVDCLRKGNFTYYLKIFDKDNQIIYDNNNTSGVFYFEFTNRSKYTINTIIVKRDGSNIMEQKEIEV